MAIDSLQNLHSLHSTSNNFPETLPKLYKSQKTKTELTTKIWATKILNLRPSRVQISFRFVEIAIHLCKKSALAGVIEY